MYRSGRSYKSGLCPVVERLYKEEFLFTSLPHTARGFEDIDVFVKALRKIEAGVKELKKLE
jgi:hypothetical protein